MRSIGHLSALYSFWLGDEDAFRSRLPDLFFIGFQERLDDDFELLKQKLGLPPTPSFHVARLRTRRRQGTTSTLETLLGQTSSAGTPTISRSFSSAASWRRASMRSRPDGDARGVVDPVE